MISLGHIFGSVAPADTGYATRDVTTLYGVETKHVNQAVRTDPGRFPAGYVFVLNADEIISLRSKTLTLGDKGDLRSRILTANMLEVSSATKDIHRTRALHACDNSQKREGGEGDACHHRDLRATACHGARHGGMVAPNRRKPR